MINLKCIMKLYIRIVFFIFLFALSTNIEAQQFSKSINKKINKRLYSLFDKKEVNLNFYDHIKYDESKYEDFIDLKFAKVENLDGCLAYVFFNKSKGKVEYFDYMLVFDKDLKIINVSVLAYRSSHGSEISAKWWLKQFIGKSSGEKMEIDDDIDSITGATLSVEAITYSITDLSVLIHDLQDSGFLD